MKKILAIAPYPYLPYFSGGQKFIAKFFEYLSREVELTVISVAENDIQLARNYKIIPLLKKSFSRYYDSSLVAKITALVEKERFDAVIWEHPYFAWLAIKIKKRTGIKTIIHTHNIEYQRFRSTGKWWWPILKFYEKRSFRKADALFFITREDKDFVINNWKIPAAKCIELPFGIDICSNPIDKRECREIIAGKHLIRPDEKILLFTGLLNYQPNLDALKTILDTINPTLLKQDTFHYKIIICGKNLPDELNSLKNYADKNIIYANFIPEIATYYKGADIFLNPVVTGGGVKTKMVEAIAYGTTVIASTTGATGILKNICGDKLIIVPDQHWPDFAIALIANVEKTIKTPEEYYAYYYWGNIIKNVTAVLTDKVAGKPENN